MIKRHDIDEARIDASGGGGLGGQVGDGEGVRVGARRLVAETVQQWGVEVAEFIERQRRDEAEDGLEQRQKQDCEDAGEKAVGEGQARALRI